jgi:hypothetical protein
MHFPATSKVSKPRVRWISPARKREFGTSGDISRTALALKLFYPADSDTAARLSALVAACNSSS